MAERDLELAQLDEYHARVAQAEPAVQVSLLLIVGLAVAAAAVIAIIAYWLLK
jgi:hypothetical protein